MSDETNDLDHLPECEQKDCTNKAFVEYVWSDKHVKACLNHAVQALKIAEHMGHPTPAGTLRILKKVPAHYVPLITAQVYQFTKVLLEDPHEDE